MLRETGRYLAGGKRMLPLLILLTAIAMVSACAAAFLPVPQTALAAEYPVPQRTLREGSSGEDVKWLQEALNGAIEAGLPVDGKYGAATAAAVKEFQTRAGLAADGIAGEKTVAALRGGQEPAVTTEETVAEDFSTPEEAALQYGVVLPPQVHIYGTEQIDPKRPYRSYLKTYFRAYWQGIRNIPATVKLIFTHPVAYVKAGFHSNAMNIFNCFFVWVLVPVGCFVLLKIFPYLMELILSGADLLSSLLSILPFGWVAGLVVYYVILFLCIAVFLGILVLPFVCVGYSVYLCHVFSFATFGKMRAILLEIGCILTYAGFAVIAFLLTKLPFLKLTKYHPGWARFNTIASLVFAFSFILCGVQLPVTPV